MLNFEIIEKDGLKYAVINMSDSVLSKATSTIYTDLNGKEYFILPNMKNRQSYQFNNRIGEAIEEIRYGDGDGIITFDLNGDDGIKVIHYLDRKYGDEIKKNTIEKFKDATFSWIIKIPLCPSYINNEDKIVYGISNDIKTFKNEKEAIKYLLNLTKEVSEYIHNYNYLDRILNVIAVDKKVKMPYQVTEYAITRILYHIYDKVKKNRKINIKAVFLPVQIINS